MIKKVDHRKTQIHSDSVFMVGRNVHTVCPRSSDPFYILKLLYKMG